jgi:carboxyl-terminal processing protease
MNAITGYFDPHTEYFPPQQKEEFEIQMSGQFEGIGAQLKQGGEFVTIEKIISGSASWRQGELEPGGQDRQGGPR